MTYRHDEEHVCRIVQALESRGVVGEPVSWIAVRRIPEQDALHLSRELRRHRWVIAHDVAVAGICYQDKLPLGVCLEDLLQQEFADRKRGADVAEVQWTRIEGATRVGLVDEIHIIASDLLGGGGQVVEVKVRNRARPIGVDIRHVHPGHERAGEGVEQALLGFVDFGNAKDVVNIGDDAQPGLGDEVGGGITVDVTLRIDVQALDGGVGGIAGGEAVVVDLDEAVKVAFLGGGDGEYDALVPTAGGDGAPSTLLAGCSCCWGWSEIEGDVLVGLLEDEDLGCQVARLGLLGRGESLNGGVDEEDVC